MYVHSHPCVHCISMKEERIKRMEIAVYVFCESYVLCLEMLAYRFEYSCSPNTHIYT